MVCPDDEEFNTHAIEPVAGGTKEDRPLPDLTPSGEGHYVSRCQTIWPEEVLYAGLRHKFVIGPAQHNVRTCCKIDIPRRTQSNQRPATIAREPGRTFGEIWQHGLKAWALV
jgi:hypothetical protein